MEPIAHNMELVKYVTNIHELKIAIENLDKNCRFYKAGRSKLLDDYFFTCTGSSASIRIAARIAEEI
jgi:hypothetical protein